MAANTKIQFRRGYSASYTGSEIGGTPITAKWLSTTQLAEGELGYEIDTGKFKIGRKGTDGNLKTWVDLPYAGGSELLAQSGVGYTRDENTNSYTIYSYLAGDDTNVTINSNPLSELIAGASGTYYKLGLADNLTNIKNVTLTENLSASSGTFTGSVSISQGLTTQGNIVSNNLDLTSIVNRLIPAQPPVFPGNQTLSLSTSNVSRILCTGFSINNNGNAGMPSNNATAPNVIFTSPYETSSITGVGPGTTGTVTVTKNGTQTGSRVMTTGTGPNSDNGTYSDLIISNDQDYSLVNSSVAAGFWQSFNAKASGVSSQGWNTVKLSHNVAGIVTETNLISWYFDNTTQLPIITNPTVVTGVGGLLYSSSVPHYSGTFNMSFDVQHLSSDTYTNNFINAITTSATNAINNVSAINRTTAGLLATPGRNYAAASAVTATINGGLSARSNSFAVVTTGNFMPNIVVNNSYGTTSSAIGPASTILIKTVSGPNASFLQEDNIPVGNSTQLGTGFTTYGNRIVGYLTNSDTPASGGSIIDWDSQNTTLGVTDATVVGGVLSHNTTNYSTGYIPAGPNLSSGRSGAQFFTFKVRRNAVSKLRIFIGGTIAGLWFKLPGTTMDTVLSGTNGWANANVQYNEALGFSNSSTGCAETSVVPLNTSINSNYTITFGPYSSSNSTNNEIHVRIKLTSGQSISSLSIQGT